MGSDKSRQGRFYKAAAFLVGFFAFCSSIVTIAADGDQLIILGTQVSHGTTTFSSAIVSFLTGSMSLPRWLVFLLFFSLLFLFIPRIIQWFNTSEQSVNEFKKVPFRDLWLFVARNHPSEIPIVKNTTIAEARCGKNDCMGRIVNYSRGGFGKSVDYLICENNHYVGNKVTYEDFMKQMEEDSQRTEDERLEREKQAKEMYQKLLNGNTLIW